MNFFGHAAVAGRRAAAAARGPLALGAMLPDFAVMCGARVAEPGHAEIARGIALHHATDRVFHGAPEVRALFGDAERRLAGRGVRRGPTRAAAHVGVELLLDGVLVDDHGHRVTYLDALAVDPAPLTWREPDHAGRFARLHARLTAHGVPDDLRRPRAAAERLFRALAPRPLLAPDPSERTTIAAVLVELAPAVAAAATAILARVESALAEADRDALPYPLPDPLPDPVP